jgi:hypothetical protein
MFGSGRIADQGGVMVDSVLWNVVIALVSAVIGAVFGHWLSVSEQRKRDRYQSLVALDRLYREGADGMDVGAFAHAFRFKDDLIMTAVPTDDRLVWGPLLGLIEAIELLRNQQGGDMPPQDAGIWRVLDGELQTIGEAIAAAKIRALKPYFHPPWYRRFWFRISDAWGSAKSRAATCLGRAQAPWIAWWQRMRGARGERDGA